MKHNRQFYGKVEYTKPNHGTIGTHIDTMTRINSTAQSIRILDAQTKEVIYAGENHTVPAELLDKKIQNFCGPISKWQVSVLI